MRYRRNTFFVLFKLSQQKIRKCNSRMSVASCYSTDTSAATQHEEMNE